MKKIWAERKAILLLIGLTALGACLIYLPFVLKQVPYEFVTIDTREENFAFYTELSYLLDQWKNTGSFPLYSWSSFLGTDFFIGRIWYITTDFTMIICALLKVYFWDALIFTTIFKVIFAALSMYGLLTCYHFSSRTKIIGALCFAFCAELTYYAVYPIFLLSFCFIPLYFMGMELYLQKGSKFPFIFATAAMVIISFYYFYIISFFSPLYFLYRYYVLHEGQWKGWFKSALKLVGLYAVGVALAGVVFIPMVLYMSNNSRIGVYDSRLFYNDIRVYLSQLCSPFLPLQAYQNIPRPFSNHEYTVKEIFFWSGSIIALLVPQLYTDKDRYYRQGTIIYYGMLILLAIVPAGAAAFHGFSAASFRGMILLVISNILIACRYLDKLDQIHKKNLRITAMIAMSICLLIVPVSCMLTGSISELFTVYFKSLWMTWISALILVLFSGYILKKSNRKYFNFILLTAIMLELWIPPILATDYLKDGSYRHSYQFMKEGTQVLQTRVNGLNDYLDSLELINSSQYYRIYIPQESLYWSLGMNSSNFYQINGLSTYDSTYAPSLNRLEEIAPEIIRGSKWYMDIRNADLINFLNVKYAVVSKTEELPEGVNWSLVDDRYMGWMSVYCNEDYRPLGTLYHKAIDYERFLNNVDLSRLKSEIVCETSDLDEILAVLSNSENQAVLENITYYGNQLSGDICSEEDGFMVITLPYDKGWKILLNGKEISKYAVNGGFIGIPIKAGDSHLEMYFISEGLKTGVIITGIGILCLIGLICYDCRKRR